jgi:hypothetical protein
VALLCFIVAAGTVGMGDWRCVRGELWMIEMMYDEERMQRGWFVFARIRVERL